MLPTKKHTRQALSLADKKRICEISQVLVKATHQQVADEFNKTAERSVQRLMVTKTLREKDKWLSMDESQLGRKRMRGGKFEALEQSLSLYLQEIRAQGTRLSDSLLTAHAERLREEHHIKDSEFKISNGWVQNFKRRHSIRMHATSSHHHGDMHMSSGDPDDTKVGDLSFLKLASSIDASDMSPSSTSTHLGGIHQLIVDGGFKPCDVFHYDEHVLHFQLPNESYSSSSSRSHQRQGRMLLGLLTNVVGDAPMMCCIQERSTRPALFADMLYTADFVYANPGAKMTKDTFTKFILHVNTVLAMQDPPRRILCFLDSSPCHAISMEGHMSTICGMRTVELSHMLLAHLPPRVPSQLTPLGAGLTTYFHLQYKITHLKSKLTADMPSSGLLPSSALSVTQHEQQALTWAAQLWKTVPASIAKTSWKQSQWLPPSWPPAWERDDSVDGSSVLDDEAESMAESLMAHAQSEWKTLHGMVYGLKGDGDLAAPPSAHPPSSPSPWTSSPNPPNPDDTDAPRVPTACQALEAAHQVLSFIEQHPVVFTHDDVAALLGVANRISGIDYHKEPPPS
ncbi:hypothetical protein H310_05011 [Aphanomyces invadans]|uniref:HTH CENPB-type domain-containing protein n=1 Tax=Aphanomyces invadans TaxID=157072 RepID=A0A024UCI3_9STRA|nr:hypothetical protein H310_05011 [Aphanomyces invadans]ETW03607.1 hypothetical protein H310_05011 [Aphanomyces invadans]|eukprot:XP_008867836.1 hypothetical protein H310_05011 [Aphanomyces invadans]